MKLKTKWEISKMFVFRRKRIDEVEGGRGAGDGLARKEHLRGQSAVVEWISCSTLETELIGSNPPTLAKWFFLLLTYSFTSPWFNSGSGVPRLVPH